MQQNSKTPRGMNNVARHCTYPYHLGADQEVQDQVAEVFSPRILSLVMSFEGTMVLNAEL